MPMPNPSFTFDLELCGIHIPIEAFATNGDWTWAISAESSEHWSAEISCVYALLEKLIRYHYSEYVSLRIYEEAARVEEEKAYARSVVSSFEDIPF